MQHPVGQREGFVPRLALVDEALLRHATADMGVVPALFGHGGFPLGLAAILGAIVMADEQARGIRQGKDILQGLVQVSRGATREIGARSVFFSLPRFFLDDKKNKKCFCSQAWGRLS